MTAAVGSLATDLCALVGEARVVSDPGACAAYCVDGMVPRHVVYPPSAEHVAALLKYAADHDLAVIPCRNTTKLEVGGIPRRYDLALSLKELNRVWHYEAADLTVSVEPGMKFGDFQHFLSRQRLWLPLDPAGGDKASLGGILAANSSGALRLRYGAPRDMVLGMKIATTEGKVVKTGGRVVKNVAGYDLGKLLVGSYGTLGVIVEASFKLFPLPPERATFILPAGTFGIARDLRRAIMDSPLEPLRLTLLDATGATQLLAGSSLAGEVKEPQLWVEVGGSPQVVGRCETELRRIGAASGAPLKRLLPPVAEDLWRRVSDPRSWLVPPNPGLIALKVTLSIGASEEFLSRARQEAEGEQVELASFSQVGVGISHLCLLEKKPSLEREGLLKRLRQAAEDLGGALVIERCPPELKRRVNVWGSTGSDFEAMRRVKTTWDPKGILSPGRFVGGL